MVSSGIFYPVLVAKTLPIIKWEETALRYAELIVRKQLSVGKAIGAISILDCFSSYGALSKAKMFI